MLSEVCQRTKDKYYMLSLTHKIWKMKQLSEYNKSRLTDIENKIVVTNGERQRGGKNRIRGLRYKNHYI